MTLMELMDNRCLLSFPHDKCVSPLISSQGMSDPYIMVNVYLSLLSIPQYASCPQVKLVGIVPPI